MVRPRGSGMVWVSVRATRWVTVLESWMVSGWVRVTRWVTVLESGMALVWATVMESVGG